MKTNGLSICREDGLPTIFVDSIYLCVAIVTIILNSVVLTGLTHISYSSSSKRFLGIRRSCNRGHPRFMLKKLQYSKSVKTTRLQASDEEDSAHFSGDGASTSKTYGTRFRYNYTIQRSPSCPGQMSYLRSSQLSFDAKQTNYWLNQLNVGRKRSMKHSPQPKARLTTALHLLYSLILADLLNSVVTLLNLLLSFWRPAYAFVATPSGVTQVEAVEPCARLILSALLYTSYNASLCSITGLMLDLYLGVVHSMHYRVVPKGTLLRYIFGGWVLALLLGCMQIILPALQHRNTTALIYRRFLLPTEPCSALFLSNWTNFCILRGTANTFRSGFITGGLLFVCAITMNTLYVLSLRKVRMDSLTRTRTMRATGARRSASLPTIDKVNGITFPLHCLKITNDSVPKPIPRCIGRQLLRSSFTLLSLTALFIAFFVPTLTTDAYYVLTHKSPNLPPWIFDLVTYMPLCVALLNPTIYSLRLNDIHVGLHNFKKRLMARSEKGFVRRQLRLHREQIIVSTRLTAHLRIRLPSKSTDTAL